MKKVLKGFSNVFRLESWTKYTWMIKIVTDSCNNAAKDFHRLQVDT